jgi:hypothetical protein
MLRRYSKKKGPVRSKKVKYDANESFPIRWKLFKAHVCKSLPNVTLYKPQNQKECDETVNLILGKEKT